MAWIEARGSGFLVRERDKGGKRMPATYCATREQAEALKAQVGPFARVWKDSTVGRILGGIEQAAKGPDADNLESYLGRIIRSDSELRQASRETYGAGLKNHIAGTTLGQTPINRITPQKLRDYWADLNGTAGIGARRNVHLLLSKAFTRAVLDGIMDVSPFKRSGIKGPSKERRTEVVPLTVREVERLAASARHPRDRMAILIMAYAGLRAGEVGGLREQDISFSAPCRVTVQRQVVQTHREKKLAPLKTKAARRTIGFPCSIAGELEAFLKDHPPASDGRIFHGDDGGLWAHSKINRQVHKAAAAAGLPPVNSHQLRHTAVALLIAGEAHPKDIQAFCGHSNISMTMNVYGHLFPGSSDKLARTMEGLREVHGNGSA